MKNLRRYILGKTTLKRRGLTYLQCSSCRRNIKAGDVIYTKKITARRREMRRRTGSTSTRYYCETCGARL